MMLIENHSMIRDSKNKQYLHCLGLEWKCGMGVIDPTTLSEKKRVNPRVDRN